MATTFFTKKANNDGMVHIFVRVRNRKTGFDCRMGTNLYIDEKIWKHKDDANYMRKYKDNQLIQNIFITMMDIFKTCEDKLHEGKEVNNQIIQDLVLSCVYREQEERRKKEEEEKRLEALYQKYKDQGLEILAFPCNQFLGQEPGTNDEIQSFCSLNYNVTFPIFDKIDVNGENESPLYTYLKAQAPFAGYPEGTEEFGDMLTQIHQKTGTGFEQGDAIKWNFGKFLVSKDGKTIIRFEPMVSPDMMEQDIEKMLK